MADAGREPEQLHARRVADVQNVAALTPDRHAPTWAIKPMTATYHPICLSTPPRNGARKHL